MEAVISILLDVLAILAIIVFGAFIVVVIADLILCLFDDHEGIIFHKSKSSKDKNKSQENKTVKKDDIVVYSTQNNPDGKVVEDKKPKTPESIDGEVVTEIDFNKAVEEQQALNRAKNSRVALPVEEEKPKVKEEPEDSEDKDDEFWDVNEDEAFTKLLDEVVEEAKDDDSVQKEEEPVVVVEQKPDETKQALDELKALKEQQQKEIEELKQMKEDFAREKEEELALLKENLEKAKTEEIEKIKQEIIVEQQKTEEEKIKLEEEQEKIEEKKENLETKDNENPVVKETIIKDEEELNKLKYKNLMRMNTRLNRIIRDTDRLQAKKQKELEKVALEKQKLAEKEAEEKQRNKELRNEIQQQNKERLQKQAEALRKKNEAIKKLNSASNRVGKYKLNSKVVRIQEKANNNDVEPKKEEVVEVVESAPIEIETNKKTPLKATAKPTFDKEFYEKKLEELDVELKDAEKELRLNKSEYVPLTRIHKSYERDSEKLRKKEILIAKQKVALYGVNSTKVDPTKKAKLDENLAIFAELKDSVSHCEEVIKKNKDRYPILEKNNQLLNKEIQRINSDIKVCEKAIAYYNKANK